LRYGTVGRSRLGELIYANAEIVSKAGKFFFSEEKTQKTFELLSRAAYAAAAIGRMGMI
jgi:hypothetical protein